MARPVPNRRTPITMKSPNVQFQPTPSTPPSLIVKTRGISSMIPTTSAIRTMFLFCAVVFIFLVFIEFLLSWETWILAIGVELGDMDSNHDKQIQSLLSYH